MNIYKEFHGPNAGYVLELYERYRKDPDSVPVDVRDFFNGWKTPVNGRGAVSGIPAEKIVAVANLAQAIRKYGHLGSRLDPLGSDPPGDAFLELKTYGLTEDLLEQLPAHLIGGPVARDASDAREAIGRLRSIYSSTTGYDYEHIYDEDERLWLREASESRMYHPDTMPYAPKELLARLTEVEVFEQFLHKMFPGKTRFSIEGLDMLIPMLDVMVKLSGGVKIQNVLIGMAHRGRLNVLAHILKKPYAHILAEFKDPVRQQTVRYDLGWTGDVKYHKGAYTAVKDGDVKDAVIKLSPNPSHLEHVNPVVEGMARAAGTRVEKQGAPEFDHSVTLPILIHGDASFPAQGVSAETLNFSRLPGYRIGGTLHIIANNQLGYTTTPEAGRSTLYASDIAKGFEIPVIHINADDVESCIEAARLAFAYRNKFQKDIVLDLIGYRRYGHNEGDEPSFTQPGLYQKIKQHPSVRKVYADTLINKNIIDRDAADALIKNKTEDLQKIYESIKPEDEQIDEIPEPPPPGVARKIKTAVPLDRLRRLNGELKTFPPKFNLNRKLQKSIEKRRHILDREDEPSVDWSTAEELALASILEDGIAIRLTGEDTERGTFSQRHAVFHDTKTSDVYIPLQNLSAAKAAFEVHNSPLSENAALGFEYGYNIQAPGRLVIWEAQYGDFINVPQVMIDEFITSARDKWGQTPSLVLLLPHGLEGQGPDHSSAQPERFLQIAANVNMRIANCTTAAQYFHLLRRQALLLKTDPLPLVVLTPKSLLRNPFIMSKPRDLTEGGWMPVIDDSEADKDRVEEVLLCSGKIYVDLISHDKRGIKKELAILRVEQLYKFPDDELCDLLKTYPKLKRVIWVQEEPENMGAWRFAGPILRDVCRGSWKLNYLGRPESSSAGEGSMTWFNVNQKVLIEHAYGFDKKLPEDVWLKKY
jgi:2-oxoglutarate dehydrogenase E1 component